MTGYVFIPAIAVIVTIFIASYIYGQREREPVSRAFLLFTADALGWLLVELAYHVPALRGQEVLLLRIGSLFWIPIGVLFLNFCYAIIHRPYDKMLYAGIVFSVIGILLNLFTHLFIIGVEHHVWGVNQVSHPARHTLLVAGTAFFGAFGLHLVFKRWRHTRDKIERNVTGLILIGGLLALLATVTLNTIIPNFFDAVRVPQLGNVTLVLFLITVFLAVRKYRFLSTSVENVAEELFEEVQEGLLLLDRAQVAIRVNRRARELLGDRLQGRHLRDILPGVDLLQGVERQEVTLGGARGALILTLFFAVSNRRGDAAGCLAVVRDVTAQKKAEIVLKRSREELEAEVSQWTAQLRRAQKMEALGTIAGSIAHDFNNLLAAILGFTHAAKNDLPLAHPVREDLEEVLAAGARAKEIIRQVLSFSRREDRTEQDLVSIDEVVQEAVDLLRVSFPTTMTIALTDTLTHRTVRCDAAEMIQVLMNLGSNAFQAMSHRDSGELHFVLRNRTIDAGFMETHPVCSPGEYVVIEVHDSGSGMTSETMERIFDPFFTTKPAGEGTGLGLSTALGIVKSHNGIITVDSRPGVETCFSIHLPAVTGAPTKDGRPSEPAASGTERILVVDDDEQMRRVAARMLTPLGYRVSTAPDGFEGLKLFEADPDRFDLIITDHTMPYMTGTTLARTIRRHRPNMPILLISGYLDDLSQAEMAQTGIAAFLKKPFTQSVLSERIRGVLSE